MKDNFKKQLWVSGSIILATILIASVGLSILGARINAVSEAIMLQRVTVLSQAATLDAFAGLKHDAPLAATYQTAMDRLLTSQDNLITFPTQIESLGQADGVSTDFSFQGTVVPATTSTPGTADFTLDATGPLANVLSFIKDFESGSSLLLSSFTALDLTGDGSNYTLSAQGVVFFK